MTKGIVYYNRGTKCIIRCMVSIHTLRNWAGYAGPLALMCEYNIDKRTKERNELPEWVRRECKRLNVQIVDIPDDESVEYALVQKTRLYRWAPFDVCLFIDADSIVLRNPEHLLDDIEREGYGVARFVDWVTTGPKIRRRIESWRCIVGDRITDEALAWGPAVNTGVFGWRRGYKMLPPLEDACVRGYEEQKAPPHYPLNRTLDEVASQVFCSQFPVALFDECWNWSVQYGLATPESGKIGIIHFHGGKHLLDDPSHSDATLWACEQWRRAYWELRNGSPDYDAYEEPLGDRNLRKYELRPKVKRDVTIVCASDEKYANKLERHMAVWMQTPGLREQRYLLLCVGAPPHVGEFERFNKWRNVEQVYYRPPDNAERRERCLSAFVYGLAEHVKTKYAMKLDGDSVVKGPFVWPEYGRYIVCADRWHYTKSKGARKDDPRHFLNALDDWWLKVKGEPPIFPPDIPQGERWGHKRFRSYCCIMRTDYIRHVVELCGPRLPIPSQDTLLWYCCERERKKVNIHKFRSYINA